MKKVLRLLLIVVCIQQIALALDEKSYYNCPSMLFYTPTLTLDKYCQNVKTLCGECIVTKSVCSPSYNKEYNKTNYEYNRGKCKITDRKFVEGTYNGAICNVDFVLKPKPRIMGIGSWSKGGVKGEEGQKCIENLTKELKNVYPNMQDYEH